MDAWQIGELVEDLTTGHRGAILAKPHTRPGTDFWQVWVDFGHGPVESPVVMLALVKDQKRVCPAWY